MDTTFTENGKEYKIVGGRVVEASVTPESQEETPEVELKLNDRVTVGKKLGTIVGVIDSVYGTTAAVKLDDGSITEKLVEDLTRAPNEKEAAVDNFEEEFKAYESMPTDTVEELEVKIDKARELNLRAKALQTNRKNSLADQILYDRVVTATYVDTIDLRDAAQRAAAAEENYLENLPKFEISETISRGGNSGGGDISWVNEIEVEEPRVEEDSTLATHASRLVDSFSKEQLENDEFMKAALKYRLETVPADQKTKFALFVREARTQKLAEETPIQHTASVTNKDLDGNEIDLDDVPFEAIFGA